MLCITLHGVGQLKWRHSVGAYETTKEKRLSPLLPCDLVAVLAINPHKLSKLEVKSAQIYDIIFLLKNLKIKRTARSYHGNMWHNNHTFHSYQTFVRTAASSAASVVRGTTAATLWQKEVCCSTDYCQPGLEPGQSYKFCPHKAPL